MVSSIVNMNLKCGCSLLHETESWEAAWCTGVQYRYS